MGIANGTLVAPAAASVPPRPLAAPDPPPPPPPPPDPPPPGTLPGATIVIPCYNHGRFVSKAVQSALAQEGADIRVVVVDDGSTDGDTPKACDGCRAERVEVIHQPNRGLPAARNAGAAGSRSEFLVFLDADDWIEPGFV